ncbi:YoaK family protein [Micromonospora sp. NPDC126480]|uniref:YoaK family protein n=1 Tax=Micromonospora sp. NPDC126480 TaxID=3155312 RepID=UPI003332ED9E
MAETDADVDALSQRAVGRRLVVLAAAAGCLDVFCVTRLGGFFASVITGNVVQFGHALVAAEARLVLGGAVAVLAYTSGVAVATFSLRRVEAGWQGRTRRVLAAESLLLAGVAAGWWATNGHPGYAATLALLAGAAVASGVQSVVTISSGIRGASTTYLTGSLTGMVRNLVLDPHRFAAGAGGAARLLGLLAGAVLGAAALRVAPRWTPVLAAALVAVVAVGARPRRTRLPGR